MADMLASVQDLRDLLGESDTTVPDAQAALLLEIATAEVQAAARQQLVRVVDDVLNIMGTAGVWLTLPERPVADVSSVRIDGDEVADYKRHGARLWRQRGWSSSPSEPSTVKVTYTHGHALDAQALQFARKMALRLAAHLWSNPDGISGGSIDDYREPYSQSGGDVAGDLLPNRSRRLLRRTYGGRVGLVRIG